MPVSCLRIRLMGPAAGVLGLLTVAWSAPVWGQDTCEAVEPGNDLVDTRAIPGGGSITYVTNPHFRCTGDVEIWADSAIVYSAQALSHLIGSARYIDGGRELRANEARYSYEVGRLQAEGGVFVTNSEDGSTVEHGDLIYLRQTDYRDIEEMTVTTGSGC